MFVSGTDRPHSLRITSAKPKLYHDEATEQRSVSNFPPTKEGVSQEVNVLAKAKSSGIQLTLEATYVES